MEKLPKDKGCSSSQEKCTYGKKRERFIATPKTQNVYKKRGDNWIRNCAWPQEKKSPVFWHDET